MDSDILEHLLKVNKPKVICTLPEFKHHVAEYNWLFDRVLGQIFIDLPIGSHECSLAILEMGHTKPKDKDWLDWMDSFDLEFADLAEQWVNNHRGAFRSSVGNSVIGRLSAIERRILCR